MGEWVAAAGCAPWHDPLALLPLPLLLLLLLLKCLATRLAV